MSAVEADVRATGAILTILPFGLRFVDQHPGTLVVGRRLNTKFTELSRSWLERSYPKACETYTRRLALDQFDRELGTDGREDLAAALATEWLRFIEGNPWLRALTWPLLPALGGMPSTGDTVRSFLEEMHGKESQVADNLGARILRMSPDQYAKWTRGRDKFWRMW